MQRGAHDERRGRRCWRRSVAVSVALCVAGTAVPASAASGDLDTTFSSDGIVTRSLGSDGLFEETIGAIRQADGRVVVLSSSGFVAPQELHIGRLDPDGTVDRSFGRLGRRSILLPEDIRVEAVAAQGDRVVVLGTVDAPDPGETDLWVLRLRPDGRRDQDFGDAGVVRLDLAAQDVGRAVAAGPGGTLLVASYRDDDLAVTRLTSSGTVDGAYDGDGTKLVGTGATELPGPPAVDLAVSADGRATLGFLDQGYVATEATRLVRLTPSGQYDIEFGFPSAVIGERSGEMVVDVSVVPGDEVSVDVVVTASRTYAVTSLIGGSIRVTALDALGDVFEDFGDDGVVALTAPWGAQDARFLGGRLIVLSGSISTWTVDALLPDGSADPAFGGGRVDLTGSFGGLPDVLLPRGSGLLVVGGASEVSVVARRADGTAVAGYGSGGIARFGLAISNSGVGFTQVLVAGDGRVTAAGIVNDERRTRTRRVLVERRRPGGSPDTAFSGDGRVVLRVDGSRLGHVGLHRDGDGTIVTAATVDAPVRAVAWRLRDDGRLDRTWGDSGRTVVEVSTGDEALLVSAIDADGRVVLVSRDEATSIVSVRRLRSNGRPDGRFGNGGLTTLDLSSGGNQAVRVLGTGTIVIADASAGSIVRLRPGGRPDTTFGPGGRRDLAVPPGMAGGALAITDQGGVVLAATDFVLDRVVVARFGPGGGLDSSFDGDGTAVIDRPGRKEFAQAVLARPNGSVLVVGADGGDDYRTRDTTVWSLTAAGNLNGSFGVAGRSSVAVDPFEADAGADAAVRGDRVVVVGQIDDDDRRATIVALQR